MKKQKIILILVVLGLLVFPLVQVHAAGLVPCGGDGESPCTVTDFFVAVARVTNFLIAMAGVFAVFQIIGAGFWMVVSQGNEETITAKKSQITTAVVGFVFVLMAYIFVNTAMNLILMSKCKIDLKDPLNYLRIYDTSQCKPDPGAAQFMITK